MNDLLDASRIRHGKLSLRPSYVSLQEIVSDATTALEADVNSRRHRLHTNVPPYPVTVYADPARLAQVVSNLLSNAVKYTPPGGDITLTVEAPDVSTESTRNSSHGDAVITVRDTGTDISPSLLPHVFDMFTQSASVQTRAEAGLGIGLSVVKYLVNAHNGHVRISSAGEGQGTEVSIQLPIVCQSPDELPGATTNVATPIRILLVDDNADIMEALAT